MELHAKFVGEHVLDGEWDVGNLDQVGRLIKSWSTRLDYVSQPGRAATATGLLG